MEQAGFIACIDLGTSNIVGLLGRRNEQGVISILASESIPSDSCIKHGIVYNIDEAAGKVKKLLNLLENNVGKKIGKVYVSIAGMSLKSVKHIERKVFDTDTQITFATLDQMDQNAKTFLIPLLTNYGAIAPERFLDGQFEADAIGKQAKSIEVAYQLIGGRPNIKSNIQRSITYKNQVGIAGFIVGAVATGAILLDDEDKNAGCAVVDFGGGTTTVSVYKGGLLRFLSVIPFGGRTITKDIQSLDFTEELAETFKIKYGRVGKNKAKDSRDLRSSDVDVKELNKVIQLRQEEILLNVIRQIEESGYAGQLEAGIVITGGASQMTGLVDFFAEKSKMPVKIGVVKRLYINNAVELLQKPSYSQCLGSMLFATENCEKVEVVPEPEPVKPEPVQPENQHHQQRPPQPQPDPIEVEPTDEPEPEQGSKNSKKGKDEKPKQRTLFDFFGKIHNIGDAIFKDEK